MNARQQDDRLLGILALSVCVKDFQSYPLYNSEKIKEPDGNQRNTLMAHADFNLWRYVDVHENLNVVNSKVRLEANSITGELRFLQENIPNYFLLLKRRDIIVLKTLKSIGPVVKLFALCGHVCVLSRVSMGLELDIWRFTE